MWWLFFAQIYVSFSLSMARSSWWAGIHKCTYIHGSTWYTRSHKLNFMHATWSTLSVAAVINWWIFSPQQESSHEKIELFFWSSRVALICTLHICVNDRMPRPRVFAILRNASEKKKILKLHLTRWAAFQLFFSRCRTPTPSLSFTHVSVVQVSQIATSENASSTFFSFLLAYATCRNLKSPRGSCSWLWQ